MPKRRRKRGRPKNREKKWLVAEILRGNIRALGYDCWRTTKAKAEKEASLLNKRAKRFGAEGVRYVVRRVGWRRKKHWS